MSSNTSPRDRKAARERMKKTGENYTTALAHVLQNYADRMSGTPVEPSAPAVPAAWAEMADALAEFVQTEGRMPRTGSTAPVEKSLGKWLAAQVSGSRKRRSRLTEERRSHLDENAPGWEDAS